MDSCLHAHSFLVKAANFASLHKGPQKSVFAGFFLIQLCSSAMESSRKIQYTFQIKSTKPKPKSKPVSFCRVQDLYGIFFFLPLQTRYTARHKICLFVTGTNHQKVKEIPQNHLAPFELQQMKKISNIKLAFLEDFFNCQNVTICSRFTEKDGKGCYSQQYQFI